MIVASFYAPRPDHKFFQDYTPFLRILDESCKRFGHKHVVLTDVPLEGFETYRINLPDNLMRACLHAQLCFLANADDDVLLVGADCVLANDPAKVFEDPDLWEIAVTLGDFADSVLNTGAIWVRKGYTLSAAVIWNDAVRACKGEWGDDQRALRDAMGITDLSGVGYAMDMKRARIKMLPVDPYNLAPEYPGDDCTRATVLHFRGPRKRWMADYCASWLGIGEAPKLVSPEPESADLLANMRVNLRHHLPAVTLTDAHDGVSLVCGSGPSLLSDIPEIAWRQSMGQAVFAINGAGDVLVDNGVTPDWLVVMDPHPERNAGFIERRSGKRFLLCSWVDSSLVDSLLATGHDVTLFHVNLPGAAEIVGTGTLCGATQTCGLTLPFVNYAQGFREVHLFGLDSSDRDGAHAYAETGTRETTVEAWVGSRRFTGSVAMVNQARKFPEVANQLMDLGVGVVVHGDGLLPALAREMEREAA